MSPKYITIRGKGGDSRKPEKGSEEKPTKVYLATDPDREGEAISWHLAAALKLDEKKNAPYYIQRDHKECSQGVIKKHQEILIWIWWTHSRQDVFWTEW